jgi:hypothetical protein
MNFLLTALSIFAGLHYVGFGLSGTIYRTSSEKAVGFAPLFGLVYLMFCSWWAYRLGFRLGGSVSLAILLPAIFLSTWVFFTKWRARNRGWLARRWFCFGAIWLVAAVVLLMPLLFHGDALILTFGNNDVAHHSAISRFLMEQTRTQLTGYPAQNPHAFVWFADNTFFGYYSFVANVASLSGRLPHEVLSAVLVCIAALITCPAFLLMRRVMGVSKRWAMFWAILAAANALPIFILYHGFGGQIFGVYFGLALLYVLITADFRPAGQSTFELALLLVGLTLCYPHMLPFVLGIAFIWRTVETWQRGKMAALLPWAAKGMISGMICCLLIPNRLLGFYLWLKQAGSDQSGWDVKFLWPDYLLGLIGSQMDQSHLALSNPNLRIGVWIALAGLLAVQFFIGSKKTRHPLVAALAALVAIYTCAVFFAATKKGVVFGDYKSFKVLTFFSPLIAVVIASCWTRFWNSSLLGRVAAGFFLAGYIFLWGHGVIAMVHGNGRGNVLRAFSVQNINSILGKPFASVNIVTENHWASMWPVYFFLDKQVYQAFPTYYPPMNLEGQVSFVEGNSKFVSLEGYPCHKTAWGLNVYPSALFVACYLGMGWHGDEGDHNWMGAQGDDAEITVFAPPSVHEIKAIVHLQPFLPNNAYSVRWNDTSVAHEVTTETLNLKLTDVRPGKNTLRLHSKLPPQAPGGGDFRLICFGLRKIELEILY